MKIIIIGNGIAGTNAARYIRKYSDHEITMVSGESEYPFSRTALMYVYMGHLRFNDTKLYEDYFWDKNKIKRVYSWVTEIDPSTQSILLKDQHRLEYDILIIASGSKSNKFGWPGQDLQGVQGLYHKQDLESMEAAASRLSRAVIVGGGLIGIEMAEMFHSRHIPVTFLVRESSFWNPVLPPEESAMINDEIRQHGVDLRLGAELKEILSDDQGRVACVITGTGDKIDTQFVGITVGVSPNIGFLQNSGIETKRGVLVDERLQTSIQNIYAIGDCAELRSPRQGRRAIEAVWYTGRMMGQTVAYNICKKPIHYNPGIWFNSAKFFNIEYQVYGDIPAITPDHINSLYWQHPSGKKSIRINFRKNDEVVTGFNLLGIRYRHEVCEKWIQTQARIEDVLKDLGLANFDPEFFKTYESEVLKIYERSTGRSLTLRSNYRLNFVTRFLQNTSN